MKRCVTDELYDSQHAANNSTTTGLDPDLLARLRNAGSRVRKSVTEGYRGSGPSSATSSSLQTRLPFTQSLSFSSSNDILRNVYDSGSITSAPSDKKRKHDILDDFADPLDEDDDMHIDPPSTSLGDTPFHTDSLIPRPMKSLRTTARRANKTQSLPVGMLDFGHVRTIPVDSGESLSAQPMEDDWSAGSFAASTPGALTLS
ncbi:hypothetical protein OBBRIDRAFT_790743 [Obba rivulosa]|uniref:Uncharacterized protein n=1 Tax=Obba rivulosa TaxID=1052685 RepID=A0A8E2B2Z3_9APHY|nr:hypothetical protein OBBRIDRAFT_790743 [Obba rivulosa]